MIVTKNITIDLNNMRQSDFAFLQIGYDSEMIIRLLNELKNKPIESVEIIPFISLFCWEATELFKKYDINFEMPDNKTFSLQDIRLKTKLFENKYSRAKKMILNCDYLQDYIFKHKLTIQPEESYKIIRNSVLTAQSKVYTVVNSAMVQAYWEIGQEIYKACGENDRAEYGKKLLEYLSEHLTKEFGKGFTVTNLKYMRQFYRAFPIRHTLCDELSWSHYRLLMRIEDEKARKFYAEKSVKSKWSVRQ